MSFKLCILNVGQHVKAHVFSVFLREKAILFGEIEKRPWSHTASLTFPSEVERAAAVAKLEQLTWKGVKLSVRVLDAVATVGATDATSEQALPLKRKRSVPDDATVGATAEDPDMANEAVAVIAKDVNDVVTPWRDIAYPAQLSRKHEIMEDVLRAVTLRSRAHVSGLKGGRKCGAIASLPLLYAGPA